ncbi:hypothetical protein BGZ94_005283 [Podila epigama]|nr:hypothetical protein BGZ94_005283 [Podila epigama]
MFRFAVAFASLLICIQLWTVSPVHAIAYAACIGVKDVSAAKAVYGFHLWSSDGLQFSHYRTRWFFLPQQPLVNNGWEIRPYLDRDWGEIDFEYGKIRPVVVKNEGLEIDEKFDESLVTVCRYVHDDRFRGISMFCKDDPNVGTWCDSHREKILNWCADYVEMGTDSVSCNEEKRPNP